jgi:O-methyltransferase involved in polyketide biosynthesis
VRLDREKETLLIPLYGKALESRKPSPVIFDAKALEIVGGMDYDFGSLKIPAKTNTMMCVRAKLFDDYTAGFLKEGEPNVVLHLGCGLDARYDRIGDPDVDWYDLDYEEVVEFRRRFFPETERYHLIGSSVTEPGWLEEILAGAGRYLVIAEGLFMYLGEGEIRALLDALAKRVGRYTLVFDAFSVYTARRVGRHPSIRRTGAVVRWGVDDPRELTGWRPDVEFIEAVYFTSNDVVRKLGPLTRLLYGLAGLFPAARNAQRILVYRVGRPAGS